MVADRRYLPGFFAFILTFFFFVVVAANGHAVTITILDGAESLSVRLDGSLCLPVGTPGAPCTTGSFISGPEPDFSIIAERIVSRFFTSFSPGSSTGDFAVVLVEPGTQVVSDIIEAHVEEELLGFRSTNLTFASDPEGSMAPFPASTDLTAEVKAILSGGHAIAETGMEQEVTALFRDATGTIVSLPGDIHVVVQSDLDVAEPPSIALFASGLVAVFASGYCRHGRSRRHGSPL
jgi:hypothetical protein